MNDNIETYDLDEYRLVGEYGYDELGTIQDAIIYGKYLIVKSGKAEKSFHFIDTESGENVCSWGRRGRGPGEYVLTGRQISVKGPTLFFADINDKKIVSVDIGSLLRGEDVSATEIDYPYTSDFRPNKFLVMDSLIICLGAVSDMRFGVMDAETGEILAHDNRYPESERIDGLHVGNVYQSLMARHPDKDLFVVSMLSSDYFELFACDGHDVKRIYAKENAAMPKLHRKEKAENDYTIDYDNSVAGNVHLSASRDMVAFLYSGSSYSEYAAEESAATVKCYDWEGRHICDYALAFPVSRIVVSGDRLFCFRQDPDKIQLYQFNLRPDSGAAAE